MRTSDCTLTYLTADHQGTAQIAINATTQQTTIRRSDPFGNVRGLDEDVTWPGGRARNWNRGCCLMRSGRC